MIKKLISIAGLTGSTFSYFFLVKPTKDLIGASDLKVSSETKKLSELSSDCYVLEKLNDLQWLVCSPFEKEKQPIFYLQETNTINKFIWKINKVSLVTERDKSYYLRFNLAGNQTLNVLVKDPIKYFWINNLDPLKDCSINLSSNNLYCERISKLNKAFTIIKLDKYL